MVTSRDRSLELYLIFDQLKAQRGQIATAPPKRLAAEASAPTTQFYAASQAFGRELASVSELVGSLARLIKEQSDFQDHGSEIASLTNIVKGKLSQLHEDIGLLQTLKEDAAASLRRGAGVQAERHGEAVVSTLRSKLVHASQSFKTVLQQRTDAIKATVTRRSRFTSDRPMTFESALFQQADDGAQPPPVAGPSAGGGQQQELQLATQNVNHYRQRHDAVRQIEAAVSEVATMFQDFTRIVHEQEELVIRIDADVDDALTHVEAGSGELLRYLANISSNRGLILKIFGILFVFLLFFGFVIVR